MEQVSSNKMFGGENRQYVHSSSTLNCAMRFAIYLPPQASDTDKVPVLYWLSGLTCTDENFMHKAGAQRIAAELGIAIVAPDTSPRGDDVANDDSYDLGQGAGFYVNASQQPWAAHFHMYDYITNELPQVIEANFPVTDTRSISGHSMGGHGALMIALKNQSAYQSVSAFSPISNPMNCPWGQKAFSAYLGDDASQWREYDSCLLMANSGDVENKTPALVSQGLDDEFLKEQLRTDALELAAMRSNYPLNYKTEAGYDHSYFFIASFIEEHLRFHHQHLQG